LPLTPHKEPGRNQSRFYPDPYFTQNEDHHLVAIHDKLPAPLPAPLRDLLRQKLVDSWP